MFLTFIKSLVAFTNTELQSAPNIMSTSQLLFCLLDTAAAHGEVRGCRVKKREIQGVWGEETVLRSIEEKGMATERDL